VGERPSRLTSNVSEEAAHVPASAPIGNGRRDRLVDRHAREDPPAASIENQRTRPVGLRARVSSEEQGEQRACRGCQHHAGKRD
jgi:hypothetical protein